MNVDYVKQVRLLARRIVEKNIEIANSIKERKSLPERQQLKQELLELRKQLRAARYKITH